MLLREIIDMCGPEINAYQSRADTAAVTKKEGASVARWVVKCGTHLTFYQLLLDQPG